MKYTFFGKLYFFLWWKIITFEGVYRLGFVIDFLSKATLVGFMAGAAIIVSLQQLKGLLGIVHFTTKMQIVPVLASVFIQRDEVYFDFDVFFYLFIKYTLKNLSWEFF